MTSRRKPPADAPGEPVPKPPRRRTPRPGSLLEGYALVGPVAPEPGTSRSRSEKEIRAARARQRKASGAAPRVRRTEAPPPAPTVPVVAGETPADAIERWFAQRTWRPFAFQREVWSAYLGGESGLVHAATGTGKTYAAWMGPVLEWLRDYPRETTTRRAHAAPLRVLWLTPLRALAADTVDALRRPVEELGLPWSVESRTGDTPAPVRARQRERLPTALVTIIVSG